jgi:SAM-dependent methyltransferase
MSSVDRMPDAESRTYARNRKDLPYGLGPRDELTNYLRWHAGFFRDLYRGIVVDHGAGTGSLSQAILELGDMSLVALEPDPRLVEILHERFDGRPNIEIFPGTLDAFAEQRGSGTVDSIVSSNVIEHIDDDEACLRSMFRVIKPGGALGLYVPARPELFGTIDAAVGHHRRYTRSDLRAKVERAGFEITRLEYCNLVGVLPWWVTGKLLRRGVVDGETLRWFDRYVLPVAAQIEEYLHIPYGLNLVLTARKPSNAGRVLRGVLTDASPRLGSSVPGEART